MLNEIVRTFDLDAVPCRIHDNKAFVFHAFSSAVEFLRSCNTFFQALQRIARRPDDSNVLICLLTGDVVPRSGMIQERSVIAHNDLRLWSDKFKNIGLVLVKFFGFYVAVVICTLDSIQKKQVLPGVFDRRIGCIDRAVRGKNPSAFSF